MTRHARRRPESGPSPRRVLTAGCALALLAVPAASIAATPARAVIAIGVPPGGGFADVSFPRPFHLLGGRFDPRAGVTGGFLLVRGTGVVAGRWSSPATRSGAVGSSALTIADAESPDGVRRIDAGRYRLYVVADRATTLELPVSGLGTVRIRASGTVTSSVTTTPLGVVHDAPGAFAPLVAPRIHVGPRTLVAVVTHLEETYDQVRNATVYQCIVPAPAVACPARDDPQDRYQDELTTGTGTAGTRSANEVSLYGPGVLAAGHYEPVVAVVSSSRVRRAHLTILTIPIR